MFRKLNSNSRGRHIAYTFHLLDGFSLKYDNNFDFDSLNYVITVI